MSGLDRLPVACEDVQQSHFFCRALNPVHLIQIQALRGIMGCVVNLDPLPGCYVDIFEFSEVK